MTTISLRDYQRECLDTIKSKYLQGTNRQLIALPTGAGKTVIFSSLIQEKKKRTLVLTHTLDLVWQTAKKIGEINPDIMVGRVTGQSRDYLGDVIVSTIQSAKSNDVLQKLIDFNPDIIIVDEAHHAASDSWGSVIKKLMKNDTLLCGFSATVMRSDGKSLADMFDELVFTRSIDWMVQHGYLCRAKGIKVNIPIDWSQVEITKDGVDYNERSLYNMMNTPQVQDIIVNTYMEKCQERKTILFGVNVDHAASICLALKGKGIAADVVHGGMSVGDRQRAISGYETGRTSVLCNCQVLTEGFDNPETDCVFMAKPTKSQNVYIQAVGRGLRKHPGKDHCLVIDLCDENHSLTTIDMILPSISEEEKAYKRRKKDSVDYTGTPVNRKLNGGLRAVLYEYMPIGNRFFWERNDSKSVNEWQLVGIKETLKIGKDKTYFRIWGCSNIENICWQSDIIADFSTAFEMAENYAASRARDFIFVDSTANWLNDLASQKQRETIGKYGYKTGLEGLTKGQARVLINHLIKTKKRRQLPVWLRAKIAAKRKW